MRNKATNAWKSVDWYTIFLYAVMVVAGWISICGASYDFDSPDLIYSSGRPAMQLVWIGTSVVLIFLIMMLDKHFFETFAYPLYGLVILLLILTVLVAPDIKGSRSWLVITSSIRLQPAEFAKFATALALARFMNAYEFNLPTARNLTVSALIILLPALCIIMQHETGSALVFLAFAMALYREGMSGYVLLMSICAVLFFVLELKYESLVWNETPVSELLISGIILAVICIMLRFFLNERKLGACFFLITVCCGIAGYVVSIFHPFNLARASIGLIAGFSIYLVLYSFRRLIWKYALPAVFAVISLGILFSANHVFNEVLQPHQQQRIKVSLGLEDDPTGTGYNVNQSKIAIGSGGFTGKGFLNGTQTKLRYVPEQDTDFIFCTVGEEFGFVGSLSVLLIYALFILRIMQLAERQPAAFGRVYGYSVASIFFFHAFVNIGMVCGITPVIGIPLPFFSYGGSSLWGFTILLFIFLRIDLARKE
ncbi:MAG: rod shape-determining protein RodA [Tannerella sp.]|jgi:rod shape determining protein RodA|nr:rod shape-determining protein RodA [Tannerella sp.]